MCACIPSNSFNIPNLFITTPVINLGALKKCTCLQPDGLSSHSIASHFLTVILHLNHVCDSFNQIKSLRNMFSYFGRYNCPSKRHRLHGNFHKFLQHNQPFIGKSFKSNATLLISPPQPGVTHKVIFKTLKSTTVKKLNHRMALVKSSMSQPLTSLHAYFFLQHPASTHALY